MESNVSEILTLLLQEAGFEYIVNKKLTDDSTITIDIYDDCPNINIINLGDEVWIWSVLCDFNEYYLLFDSYKFLSFFLNIEEEVFCLGQPTLKKVDGKIELRAQIRNESLVSVENFIEMIETYYFILKKYLDFFV
ncbi:hypothetical protein [Candidatus Arsenophonus triatominarum]|uniref:InvB/SpaK family type III secretion system chaperone n=1 Tax=Candidatus Arsenophonus triatominarum TaxID=57911 RepID=UPI0007C588A6|nr:hypothetical protein [Candidatus Arsenophonus triatominarum]